MFGTWKDKWLRPTSPYNDSEFRNFKVSWSPTSSEPDKALSESIVKRKTVEKNLNVKIPKLISFISIIFYLNFWKNFKPDVQKKVEEKVEILFTIIYQK